MRKNMKKGVRFSVLPIVVLFVFTLSLLGVYANGITILNSGAILSDQDLSFQTCVDGSSIKHSLYCVDTGVSKSHPAISYVDNCVVSTINLVEFPCSEIDISATYLDDGVSRKLTKSVSTKKTLSNPETILDKQEWDGGWGTPSDTGYAIWILSRYSPVYDKQISEGLDWLKLQRKEQEKCWTSQNGECNLYQTSRTLAFLHFAGFNYTEKIYQDGSKWLESQINYIEDSEWDLEIDPSSDGNCTIKYGSSTLYAGDVEKDEKLRFTITPSHETLINVSCPDIGEEITIYDSEGKNIFYNDYEVNSDDYFDYTLVEEDDDFTIGDDSLFRIPPSCWSSNEKWDYCHRQTTLYASLIPEIDKDKRDGAREWLEDELRSGDIVGAYLSTSQAIVDTAIYLYAFDSENEDVRDWIVHKQNNDGSWGDGSTENIVKSTAYSLLALKNQTYSGSDSVFTDGISWLSSQYPDSGWDTFEQDAISFIILRDTGEKRLKSDPSPIKISDSDIRANISNPTAFDLVNITTSFTNGLGSVVSISSIPEIGSYESTMVTVSSKATKAGFYAGSLLVNSNGTQVLQIPITLEEKLYFDISPKLETAYFFSDIQNIDFEIKSNGDFSCTIKWDSANISSTTTFTSKSSETKSIPVTISALEDTVASGILSCETQLNSPGVSSYEIPFSFAIKYYDVSPFTVKPSQLSIKGTKNGSIKITNNLDDSFMATLQFVKQPAYLTLGKSALEIPAGETVEVDVYNIAFPIVNLTTEELAMIEVKALGETELVEVSLYIPPLGEEEGSLVIMLLVFTLIAGAGGGYYYYYTQQSKENESEEKKKPEFNIKKKLLELKSEVREVLPPSLQKYLPKSKDELDAEKAEFRKTLQKTHLKDMVVVMKKMEKTDTEIKNKLLHEGLSEKEIADLINMVSLEEEIDQNIKQEEQTLGIIQEISENAAAKDSLQKKGFTPDSIKKALEELKHDVTEKEDMLKKQAGRDKDEK